MQVAGIWLSHHNFCQFRPSFFCSLRSVCCSARDLGAVLTQICLSPGGGNVKNRGPQQPPQAAWSLPALILSSTVNTGRMAVDLLFASLRPSFFLPLMSTLDLVGMTVFPPYHSSFLQTHGCSPTVHAATVCPSQLPGPLTSRNRLFSFLIMCPFSATVSISLLLLHL